MEIALDTTFEKIRGVFLISNNSAEIILNEFKDCILFFQKCQHRFYTSMTKESVNKLDRLLEIGNLIYIAARSSNRCGTSSARYVSATYIIVDPAKAPRDLTLQIQIGQLEYKQMLQDEKNSYSDYIKECEDNRKACIRRDIEELVKEKNEWSTSSSDRAYYATQKINDKLDRLRSQP